MSMAEKYGSFVIDDILFYNAEEKDHFIEEINKTYHNFITKVNGKRLIGKGFIPRYTPEEKSYLGLLKMQMKVDDEHNVVSLTGNGHRRVIVPLEMYVRRLFDERRVVSYNVQDTLVRNINFGDEEELNEELDFERAKRRQVDLFRKGELEPPAPRNEQKEETEENVKAK